MTAARSATPEMYTREDIDGATSTVSACMSVSVEIVTHLRPPSFDAWSTLDVASSESAKTFSAATDDLARSITKDGPSDRRQLQPRSAVQLSPSGNPAASVPSDAMTIAGSKVPRYPTAASQTQAHSVPPLNVWIKPYVARSANRAGSFGAATSCVAFGNRPFAEALRGTINIASARASKGRIRPVYRLDRLDPLFSPWHP